MKLAFDADLVVPDKDKTLHKGAIAPWSRGPSPLYTQTLQALAATTASPWTSPGGSCRTRPSRWSCTARAAEKIRFVYDDNARKYEVNKTFEGVLPNLERRWRETDSSLGARGAGPLPVRDALRGLRRARA